MNHMHTNPPQTETPEIRIPAVVEGEFDKHAGTPNGRQLVEEAAGNKASALNSAVDGSKAKEQAYRDIAANLAAEIARLRQQQGKHPLTRTRQIDNPNHKLSVWDKAWGWGCLAFLGVLLAPLPLVVAYAVADSQALDAVADNWALGIPIGIPMIAGIFAAGLLRKTLLPNDQDKHDQILSKVLYGVMAVWFLAFSFTFLMPVGGEDFSGGVSLWGFYAAHIALEICAGVSLPILAERHLLSTKTTETVPDEAFIAHGKLITETFEEMNGYIRAADACEDYRERLAAGKAAYVAACLAEFDRAESRRGAAMSNAAANFSNTSATH